MTFKRKFSEGRPEYQLRKTLGFDMTENNEIQIVPKEADIPVGERKLFNADHRQDGSSERNYTEKRKAVYSAVGL